MRSHLLNLIHNPKEHRLRSFWRILLQSILLIGFIICISFFAYFLKLKISGLYFFVLSEFGLTLAVTSSVLIARIYLDKKSFSSLGLFFNKHAVLDVCSGFIIAGLMMTFIFFFEKSIHWVTITGYAWEYSDKNFFFQNIGLALILFILVGWVEELLSRGYHLQNITEGTNKIFGALIAAIIFALLHQDNPQFSLQAFLGLVLAGLFFIFAYLQTRQLWLPIGLHIGWNFFEGTVFGYQVSGLTSIPHFIDQRVNGPIHWTGGEFGPEAGLILLPALAIGIICVYFYKHAFIKGFRSEN